MRGVTSSASRAWTALLKVMRRGRCSWNVGRMQNLVLARAASGRGVGESVCHVTLCFSPQVAARVNIVALRFVSLLVCQRAKPNVAREVCFIPHVNAELRDTISVQRRSCELSATSVALARKRSIFGRRSAAGTGTGKCH